MSSAYQDQSINSHENGTHVKPGKPDHSSLTYNPSYQVDCQPE